MKFSTKQLKINKANTQIIIMISVASSLVVFSLVGSRALLNQRSYQNRVVTAKSKALDQIKKNVKAVDSIAASYDDFVNQPVNIIGGSRDGFGDHDGDNAKIILDALPSQYDYPAMVIGLNKLMVIPNVKATASAGSDDELNQLKNTASSNPQPIVLPVSFTGTGTYDSIQTFLTTLQRSIRPIQVSSISLSGTDANMTIGVTAQTFYQPGKKLSIKQTVIK